jgi:hypothetical protein
MRVGFRLHSKRVAALDRRTAERYGAHNAANLRLNE